MATTTTPQTSTPAPATPASAPPAAQSASTQTPQAAPPSPSTPPLNDAFADIDKIIAESQQQRPDKPTAKPQPKPTEPTKTEEPSDKKPTPAQDESQALKAPELRAAYTKLKTEHKEAKDKLTQAEQRLKELESKVANPEEQKKIQERIEAAEKRAKELEDRIRFVDYEQSPEYEEKYHKPFINAYQNARSKIASLKIVERKNDVDEVIQEGRKATPEDFDAIMRIGDDAEAAEAADRLFGPLANLVIYQREKVMELNGQRVNAIEEFKKTGSERMKKQQEQTKAMQEKIRATFKTAVENGITKYPQWFKPDDGDEEGKSLLDKGMLSADTIFANDNRAPEERAVHHAAFRNMAGAFPFVALKLHRAELKVKELEKELKQYKDSTPSEPSGVRGAKKEPISVDEEIDSLAVSSRR